MSDFSRREFLQSSLVSGVVANSATESNASDQKNSDQPWYKNAYRRAVIDMHISDWDEKFLSEFDADQYVQMLVKSRAQSIVCYCQSHVGLFNYPTQVGQQHRGLKGRNILQEMIDGCHQNNIAVVIYTSLIFDRWSADQHPEWRMVNPDGNPHGQGGRHGLNCINSPYREYVRNFVTEICQNFDFEGIRFDMTFWPVVCYCSYCRKRFADEVGGDLPVQVDWFDPRWVSFQKKREEWLADFASIATGTVKKIKPNVSVEHQSSTFPLNWLFGVGASLAKQNDFLQGDFYGDAVQGSFVRKLLEDLTPKKPYAYETSFMLELKNHTARKSEPLLETKASSAIADNAAFVFIDAIDPIGTVNPTVHERMGNVFDRLMPYYPYMGGERVRDVSIFYSLESKYDFSKNGHNAGAPDISDAHTESSMKVARHLIRNQIPFGVLTKESLDQLDQTKVLVLSNVNMLDEEEAEAIRNWVRAGGTLYASGGSSVVNKEGKLLDNFMLSDLFGVSLKKASWEHRKHYVSPTLEGAKYFTGFSSAYPVFLTGYGMEVNAADQSQVLAKTTFPWTGKDSTQFASIHSDPPWEATENPEVVLNHYGKGKVIYSSSLIENQDELEEIFVNLIRELNSSFHVEADAPSSVEVTLFHQPEKKRYLLSLVNFQKEMPNIPIDQIRIRLNLPVSKINQVIQIPAERKIPFQRQLNGIDFVSPRLETLNMFAIDYA